MNGEEYEYRGTVFLVECKEHINRVAGPGSRNYIIRGIISYGAEVHFPGSVDGDPVTSFLPMSDTNEKIIYPGIKKLRLPEWLGRFAERNDIFPDLERLEVNPENRIFTTDGKMLFRDSGRELSLSLSAGSGNETVTVPYNVIRLGPSAFSGSRCREIIFENAWIEACDTSFDRSEWLELQGPTAYVGNMLYKVTTGNGKRISVSIREGTERINKNAFSAIGDGVRIRVCIPEGMELPGLTDALICTLRKRGKGLITISRDDGKTELPVPSSLDTYGTELLREVIDLGSGSFDEVFMQITGRREKLDYALFISSGVQKVNKDIYLQEIGRNEEETVRRAVEILGEERLCRLIKYKYIGKEAFLKILPELQEKGMVSAAAKVLIMI